MKLLKPLHKHKSERVKSYKDIKEFVDPLCLLLESLLKKEKTKHASALHHAQVTETPFNFFVLNKSLVNQSAISKQELKRHEKDFFFPSQVIINPEIIEVPETISVEVPKRKIKEGSRTETEIVREPTDVKNLIEVAEGCLSFPDRDIKRAYPRHYEIKVRYQVKGLLGLRTVTERVRGHKAHIFQHEIDHANGVNIYHK